MWKAMVLAAVLAAALASPASAAGRCHAPAAPVAVDGSTASKAQLMHALRRVRAFIVRSDRFQDCLMRRLVRAQDHARRAHIDLDPSIAAAIHARIAANQALKEKSGADFNAAAMAYHLRCAGDPIIGDCPARPTAAVEP